MFGANGQPLLVGAVVTRRFQQLGVRPLKRESVLPVSRAAYLLARVVLCLLEGARPADFEPFRHQNLTKKHQKTVSEKQLRKSKPNIEEVPKKGSKRDPRIDYKSIKNRLWSRPGYRPVIGFPQSMFPLRLFIPSVNFRERPVECHRR